MKTTQIVLLGLFVVLAIVACQEENLDPDNKDDPKEEAIGSLSNFWYDQRTSKTQTFTVTSGSWSEIVGAEGTKITIYSNSFLRNGQPVSGNFQVDLIEVYDKGTMMTMGLNTMGLAPSGSLDAMVSGGEFYINATQNGQELDINPSSPIQVATAPFPDADFNNDMMPLELGIATTGGALGWIPNGTAPMSNCRDSSMIALGQSTYCFQIGNNAQWTNCDYFNNTGTPLTDITVKLPNIYDGNNASVMITFDGLNLVTDMYSGFSNDGSFFLSGTYQIPLGQDIHLVVIAEQNGNLVYHIQSINVTNNQVVTLGPSDLINTTVANLQTQLSNLP